MLLSYSKYMYMWKEILLNMLKRFPTQNHKQIGPQIHFCLLCKYINENYQLPPHVTEVINVFQGHINCSTFCIAVNICLCNDYLHVTEVINVFQGHINCSTFCIAVNICLCNDYLHMHFLLTLEPPDPAGAERKIRHYFK